MTADPALATLLTGGLVTAFLHAVLPTHWLPFVLVGRAQGWRLRRVLCVAGLAGLAHIASTAAVGLLIVGAGVALDQWIGGLLPHLAAILLFLFGAFYLARASVLRRAPGEQAVPPAVGDRAAVLGLVAMLAVSPGEVLLPLYLAQATAGPAALALLTLAFLIGTVVGMLVFIVVAHTGFAALRLERWARYEAMALGLTLIVVGLFVASHGHAEDHAHGVHDRGALPPEAHAH